MAGQAGLWVRALRDVGCDRSMSFQIARDSGVRFDADLTLTRDTASETFNEVLGRDIILFEGCLWMDGSRPSIATWVRLVEDLLRKDKQVGLIFHGSDIRHPARHKHLHPASIFHSFSEERLLELSRRAEYTWEIAEYLGLPSFYTTPDLRRYAPSTAAWLPLTIESAIIEESERLLVESQDIRDSEALRVFHSPSSQEMKGTSKIVNSVESFAKEGGGDRCVLFDYNPQPFEKRTSYLRQLKSCDVFVDQVGIGGLGLAALEALILGKVVVTDCGPDAFEIYRKLAPGLPIFDAAESIDIAVAQAVEWGRSVNLFELDDTAQEWRDGIEKLRNLHDGTPAATAICREMSISNPPAADRS